MHTIYKSPAVCAEDSQCPSKVVNVEHQNNAKSGKKISQQVAPESSTEFSCQSQTERLDQRVLLTVSRSVSDSAVAQSNRAIVTRSTRPPSQRQQHQQIRAEQSDGQHTLLFTLHRTSQVTLTDCERHCSLFTIFIFGILPISFIAITYFYFRIRVTPLC